MSDIATGYRIPELEEFVQGFEFEVANDHGLILIDTEEETVNEIQKVRSWVQSKVWWKAAPDEIITDVVHGRTTTYSGELNNFFKPFDEAAFLKQGLIRVKI